MLTGEISKREACLRYDLHWRTRKKILTHEEPPGYRRVFDVIGTDYERTSVILTTNLPFENGTEVPGRERLTGAALDRITHRCQIIETTGESYRLHDAKRRRRSPA